MSDRLKENEKGQYELTDQALEKLPERVKAGIWDLRAHFRGKISRDLYVCGDAGLEELEKYIANLLTLIDDQTRLTAEVIKELEDKIENLQHRLYQSEMNHPYPTERSHIEQENAALKSRVEELEKEIEKWVKLGTKYLALKGLNKETGSA